MSNDWQVFFVFGFFLCFPFALAEFHRILMAWYMYRTKGTWIVDGWQHAEPPKLITLLFGRRKKL